MTNEQNARGQGLPPEVGPVKAAVIKVLRGTIALLETAVTKLEAPPSRTSGSKTSNLPGWAKVAVLATLALVTVWGVTALFPQPAAEVAIGGTGGRGAGGTGGPPDQGNTPRLPVSPSPGPVSEVEPRLPVSGAPPVSESVPVSESATPSPEPPPEQELQLTPEQVLIAAIESQIQNVTSKLGDGLIRSLQADFARSKLVVLLSNEWYSLTSDRQNQLASEMLVEARGLDFQTLEITDSERHLLARSPVVGSGMIILRRSLPLNTEDTPLLSGQSR